MLHHIVFTNVNHQDTTCAGRGYVGFGGEKDFGNTFAPQRFYAAGAIFVLLLLAYLVSLSASLFAAGVAMRLRTMQAGPLMQMPVFLVLFLAPVYVPLDLLSGWVHAVAKVNPVTPLIETGRDFISGSPATVGLAYGIGAALVVLFGWWAVRGLRSAEAAGG